MKARQLAFIFIKLGGGFPLMAAAASVFTRCIWKFWNPTPVSFQHCQARSDLLIRLFGSRLVFSLVSFFFIPSIRAQKLLRRAASFLVFGFGAGGLRFIPSRLAEARPLALRPPFGFLPSLRCHAGDLAIRAAPYFECKQPPLTRRH